MTWTQAASRFSSKTAAILAASSRVAVVVMT